MTKRLRQPLISFLTQTYMKIQYIREKNTFYSVLWQDDPTLLKERWGRGFGEANTWLTVSHCVFFRSAILLVNWQYHSHSEKRSHCQTDSFKMDGYTAWCKLPNLTVLFFFLNFINFDKIPNTADWNAAPKPWLSPCWWFKPNFIFKPFLVWFGIAQPFLLISLP